MKTTKLVFMLMLMAFAFTSVRSQDFPPKHRGMHPRLQADGKVVDEKGTQLGYIKNDGKVCDVTGKVIGIIAQRGEVLTANGKGIIGVIQKDKSFRSKNGHIVTTENDGTVKVAGKAVAYVDKRYRNKAHGCAVHCFFSEEYEEAEEVDKDIDM